MKRIILLIAIVPLMTHCGTTKKINSIKHNLTSADISIPQEITPPPVDNINDVMKDTLEAGTIDDGPIIMNAIKDENGEMTATDVICAAMVTARFRNVAERHGKVDLQFQVTVPAEMQDSHWQLRLNPDMFIMGDSIRLEPVIITGSEYRKRQLKGYEQYRKFLNSIISDPDKLINQGQLETFLKRNLPAIYRFCNDSSYVSDAQFASVYGITEQAAVEHYTRKFIVNANARKLDKKDKMYNKYIKSPILTEGIRLDTVIVNSNGDFVYDYTQTISTQPGLKKAEITLAGNIFENGYALYDMPQSKPLTFYISSLSTLADMTERYLKKVISRRVEANTACYVDFKSGSSEIEISFGNNHSEIHRIKKNLASLAADTEFDLDSIIVTASSSPEGNLSYNERLSTNRAKSISSYFDAYLTFCQDSIRKERGTVLHFDGTDNFLNRETASVKFISRTAGENWKMLDALIAKDSLLTFKEKQEYIDICQEPDVDIREKNLSKTRFYQYLRRKLYPRLRVVQFDFHLHRKGIVSDTVATTVLDTVYMAGLQAITDRDYKKAVEILKPYQDINLAIAYCALDYNASAYDILNKLPPEDKIHYMLAILDSRTGNYGRAIEHYLTACSMNPSFVHRGNLDPEISSLIKKYRLEEQ